MTFVSPAEGRVTSEWGRRHLEGRAPGFHRGIDIAPPVPGQRGQKIYAAYGGTVRYVRTDSYNGDRRGNAITGTWNTGNLVIIDGPGGGTELYGHLDEVFVKAGQVVKAGDVLGLMGDTGNIGKNAVHLHFECWGGREQGGGTGAGNTLDPRDVFARHRLKPGAAPVLPKTPTTAFAVKGKTVTTPTLLEVLSKMHVYVFFEIKGHEAVANLLDRSWAKFPSHEIKDQFATQLTRNGIPWRWHEDAKGSRFVAEPQVFGREVAWA